MRGWTAQNRDRLNKKKMDLWHSMSEEKRKGALAKQSANYKKHREKRRLYARLYYQKKSEQIKLKVSKYRSEHLDECRRRIRENAKANRPAANARGAAYRASRIHATPKWVDRNAIRKFYDEAKRLTLSTGILHHVDHIYPLRGKEFRGLHVPWNLQVLTEHENCSKQNKVVGMKK